MYNAIEVTVDNIISELEKQDVEFKEDIAFSIVFDNIEELQLYIMILMSDSGCEQTFFAFHDILQEYSKVTWFYKVFRLELVEHINNICLRLYDEDYV